MASVLVHIEVEGDRPTAAALAALGEARRIASALGATLYAATIVADSGEPPAKPATAAPGKTGGPAAAAAAAAATAAAAAADSSRHEALVAALGRGGADKVVLMPGEGAAGPVLWGTVGAALAAACEHLRPALVLLASTAGGHDVAPRLAARLGAAFVAEPVVEMGSRGEVVFSRPVYGGSHRRRLSLDDLDHTVVVTLPATARPTKGSDDAELMLLTLRHAVDRRVTLVDDLGSDDGALERAHVVVTAGGGVTAATWPLCVELAAALGATLGATRTLCVRGVAPAHREIGLGARHVAPQLYVVVGASGSAGHLAAVSPDAEIVAIDRNPDAPIFRAASYGLVGDLAELVPALIGAIGALGAPHARAGARAGAT